MVLRFRTMLACIAILFSGTSVVLASPEVRKAAALTTATEAVLASIALVQDRIGFGDSGEFTWSMTYSERDWTLRLAGTIGERTVDLAFTGYVWGGDQESLVVAFSAVGALEADTSESVTVHGRADWEFDSESSDYRNMNFREVAKFGENTIWGWVIGAEVLVGGTIGAGAAVVGTSAATGGAALGAAPWIAAGGFLGGSSALISASSAAKSMLESDEPVAAPSLPNRPQPPESGTELLPEPGTILTAVSGDGQVWGSGPNGVHVLKGSHKEAQAEGTVGGQ